MRLRRLLQGAAASVTLVSPLAAFAASVTTDPAGQAAPALAMPVLVALVLALVGIGLYSIRGRSAGAVAGFALVAGLSLLAGLGYATLTGVVIENGDCNQQSVHVYSNQGSTLTSDCPNPIEIEAIDCDMAPTDLTCISVPECRVGQILSDGDYCMLPACVA